MIPKPNRRSETFLHKSNHSIGAQIFRNKCMAMTQMASNPRNGPNTQASKTYSTISPEAIFKSIMIEWWRKKLKLCNQMKKQ